MSRLMSRTHPAGDVLGHILDIQFASSFVSRMRPELPWLGHVLDILRGAWIQSGRFWIKLDMRAWIRLDMSWTCSGHVCAYVYGPGDVQLQLRQRSLHDCRSPASHIHMYTACMDGWRERTTTSRQPPRTCMYMHMHIQLVVCWQMLLRHRRSSSKPVSHQQIVRVRVHAHQCCVTKHTCTIHQHKLLCRSRAHFSRHVFFSSLSVVLSLARTGRLLPPLGRRPHWCLPRRRRSVVC